jgi:hypothetical protein
VPVDEPQRPCVAVAVRDNRRLENDGTALHVHNRKRVRVAMGVDTNDVVQLICEHPKTNLQPKRWGHEPVPVWDENRAAAEL